MSVTATRRKQASFNPFLATLLIVVGVFGALVTLQATGNASIPFLDGLIPEIFAGPKEPEEPAVQTCLVPVSARKLEAGKALELADIFDSTTQSITAVRVKESELSPAWILDWKQIEGRVLRHAKLAQKAFTEADFLPRGTRPGILSLVPEGMCMVTLSAKKVKGLGLLDYRDRFDLLVSVGVSKETLKELEEQAGDSRSGQLDVLNLKAQTDERILVQGGMVLPRDRSATGLAQEVPVAIPQDAVADLLQALKLNHEIYCAARSGRGDQQGLAPIEPRTSELIDSIKDSKRSIRVINGQDEELQSVPTNAPEEN